MAERKQGDSRTRRQSGSGKADAKPEAPASPPPGGPGSEPASSASRSTSKPEGPASVDPLSIEQPGPFEPPDDGTPHVEPDPDYAPAAPPELIDWTPERAAAIVKAGGLILHSADALGHEPGGEQLWRATADDCEAIAAPLARILNRYEPARRLAGRSDEVELTFALGAYARRNLATRGRLLRELRADEEDRGPEWPGRGDVEPGDVEPQGPGGIADTFGTGGEE